MLMLGNVRRRGHNTDTVSLQEIVVKHDKSSYSLKSQSEGGLSGSDVALIY
jgi:hypothetical protein